MNALFSILPRGRQAAGFNNVGLQREFAGVRSVPESRGLCVCCSSKTEPPDPPIFARSDPNGVSPHVATAYPKRAGKLRRSDADETST